MSRSGLIRLVTLSVSLVAAFSAMAAPPMPQQVINLHSGPGPVYGSTPTFTVVMGGIAYFRADDGIHGQELWRSDGTPGGTWMVKDIHPGIQGSSPMNLTVFGSEVCFSADDGSHGQELWCSDGTDAGTRMVRAIRPGRIGSDPQHLTVMGGVLYFSAADDEHGRELWRSDGSLAGTTLVRDIEPGPASSTPSGLRAVGGVLLFNALRSDAGRELWRSNGTTGGTTMVRDIRPGADSAIVASGAAAVRNGIYYFAAHDGSNGRELWRSDGTFAGTSLVTVLNAGGDSNPVGIVDTAVGLLFSANPGGGSRLWVSDGSSAGTVELPGWSSSFANSGAAVSLDGEAYFAGGSSFALWRTNGTPAGTVEVGRTNPGETFDQVSQFTVYDGQVFFRANSPSHGNELHRYPPGGSIVRVTDINPGTASATPNHLAVVGTRLLFAANRDGFGSELWRFQTGVGTAMVVNIAADGGSSWPRIHGVAGGRVVFTAFRDDLGRELWASDGSAAGTELLADADPGPASGIRRLDSQHHVMAEHDGALYYMAFEPATGEELWRTDGTPAGTFRVTNLCDQFAGCSAFDFSTPHHAMVSAGDHLWFAASENTGDTARMWRSDGSAAGTIAVEPRLPSSPGRSRPPAATCSSPPVATAT
ncbi:MAG TPA: hypothetical protein PKZ76_02580 [Xanthomonadaceae bacterium]|nr:hypothetical protein [Xanthomonadaceae bacterium]